MKKLSVLLIIILFVWGCKNNSASTEKNKEHKQPNIIYILADDLGIGDINVFNKEGKIKTPNIDQLAKEGMLFSDAHTSSSVCTPTRYGILTGRYNWRSKLKSSVLTGTSKALISSERSTVASILKKNGYYTGFIGKWHLGWDWALKDSSKGVGSGWNATDYSNIDFSKPITNGPNDLGFDYSYGHSGSLDMAPYVYVENGMSTQVPDSVTVNKGKYSWWRKGPTSNDFIHEDVTPNFFRRGIDFVKKQATKDKPFFLYFPLPSPHTPILPTKDWQEKSGLNPYADFVMMIDDYIGKLIDQVKKLGIEENTLIIFTSDNGVSPAVKLKELTTKGHFSSAIYRGHKADIFEGGHRVPFIVKWPNIIQPNTTNSQTICTTDLMATVAGITNYTLEDTEGEDSYSLLPLFKKNSTTNYQRKATVHHSIKGSFAIRKENYKLIMSAGSGGWSLPRPNSKALDTLPKIQLYNLAKDPEEQQNLQGQMPQKVEELTNLLNTIIENGRSTEGMKQQNDTGPIWKELWWMKIKK